jgi:tetratricopeptide (TPR) repeat protein
MRLLVILALTLIATGCAARVPVLPPLPHPAFDETIDGLIRHGCYTCLEQAYEKARSLGIRLQAFEAATLLTLRSKELGLPPEVWLGRTRELAGTDAALSPYLDIADVIPPDRLSENRDALFDIGRRNRVKASLVMWRTYLRDGPGSGPFRAYLDVALICSFGTLKETPESFSAILDPDAATPLFQYAVGACDASHRARLSALRASDADFVDADYALGRYALDDPANPDAEESLKRWESAARTFPRSPAIATHIGNLFRMWEDWTPALAAFDAALAVAPSHPEATIGRAVSLSRLERPQEAIETATRLIDGGQWLLGEAYYWRAWNYLRLENLQQARADADRARMFMSNSGVMVLSGVIEWRLGRLATAEQDFAGALAIDLGECEAAFDLGVVRDQLGKRPEALAAFKQAGQCYDLSIAVRREAIDKIRSGNSTETLKARDSARHERVLVDLTERRREVSRVVDAIEKARPVH